MQYAVVSVNTPLMMAPMSADTLIVVRGEFMMEDPWAAPPACEGVQLRRAIDGSAPRLDTSVCAYYDDEYLTLLFSFADDYVAATLLGHDEPLYNEDVVEVFLAPRVASEYFEIEVNPLGTTFDARIESPHGVRASMTADEAWECKGLIAAVRRVRAEGRTDTVDIVMRIPFASLAARTPRDGHAWLGNLFRIDRHPQHGVEYSAWRPTLENPADFHVTAAFGRFLFGR